MDTSTYKEFVELAKRKKQLKADLKITGDKMEILGDIILEEWIETGSKSHKIDGIDIYLHSQGWATPREGKTRFDVVNALEVSGMDEYVNFNSQSFSAFLREASDDDMPDDLKEVVELKMKHSIRARKS